jgi:hypothetical protein
MKGLGITALFAFVALLLSYGLFLPSDLKSFSLVAAAASMAGYALGTQSSKVTGIWRIALVIVVSLVCASCLVAYVIFVQRGSGETFEIVRLAILLFGAFFSFAFLMPLVGISIPAEQPSKKGH